MISSNTMSQLEVHLATMVVDIKITSIQLMIGFSSCPYASSLEQSDHMKRFNCRLGTVNITQSSEL